MPKINNSLIYKLPGIIVIFFTGFTCIQAQSKAHDYSGFAVIDPAYNSTTKFPASQINEQEPAWIYGPAELECRRLQVLQQRKDSAGLSVGYPGVFHKPYAEGSFRLKLKNPFTADTIRFRVVGRGNVYVNDILAGSFIESDSVLTISLKKETKTERIQFDITTEGEPPALLIESRELSTSDPGWDWKSSGTDWERAFQFPQNIQKTAPHKLEDPVVILNPSGVKNNLYDFGKELFGYIIIRSNKRPLFNAGESEKEALDIRNKSGEQSLDLMQTADGSWKTKSPIAFRYIYAEDIFIEDIACAAIFYPVSYRGAFACSDSVLTKIWMNSAYTLRLCMHDFFLDGMKRDRLPWAGDLAISLLANTYTFSDRELVRRSLVALGREGIKEKDINGIIDYSLWWIISQDLYQLYYDDSLHLSREWKRIKETLSELSSRCDSNGFLIPAKDNWLFIDWVDQEKWTALQVLWWWAQNSGANLARRIGDIKTADYLTVSSGKLKTVLTKVAWDEKEQIWLSGKDASGERTRHPNFLAIISGLATQDQYAGIRKLLENDSIKPAGTPYMTSFQVMALDILGNKDYLQKYIIDYWGGMLNKGATTFWEAYNSEEGYNDQYSFYGRPYGKSLCHAWSAGPAAFLPSVLFGLKPLEDGWKLFTLNPDTGSLSWASVCLPTKYGNITVDIENDKISISIPEGTALQWKGSIITGPRKLNLLSPH